MLTLLITLDCVRADHVLGDQADTPALDRFRGEAVTFTSAYAHSNTTLPSHVTLFTGLLMPEHGVDHNFFRPTEEHLFLAECFRERGLPAAGFVGIEFLAKLFASHLDGGDRYYDLPKGRLMRGLARRMGVRGQRRGAAKTLESALDWILGPSEGRGFCWAHLFDTHQDYQAGRAWRRRYKVPEEPSSEPLDRVLQKEHLASLHPVLGERHPIEYYPRLYQASVSETDALLGRMFERLKAEGLWEKALIVVTADHGENLTEHGVYCGHPLIFDETIHVPLLIKFPGGEGRGREVALQVGHEDVLPTILGCNGWPCDRGRGVDLAAVLSGAGGPARPSFAFHNRMYQASVRMEGATWIENLDLSKVEAPLLYLYEATGLYDREGRRLDDPALAQRLRTTLSEYLSRSVQKRAVPVLEDESIKDQLRGLGYME